LFWVSTFFALADAGTRRSPDKEARHRLDELALRLYAPEELLRTSRKALRLA